MIKRLIYKDLTENIFQFPAVALLGPRQVGKTTLAKQLIGTIDKPSLYLDLEKPQDQQKLKDAYTFLDYNKDKFVIIDEVQTMPELFQILRPLIDEHRVPARFLLLGSASPTLRKGVSETLAGRIAYEELAQINLLELEDLGIGYEKHWFRGGFPEGLLANTDKSSQRWLDQFIRSYLERDFDFIFGVDFSKNTLRNLWLMLAHLNGGILNIETIARSLGLTGPTVARYLDYMEAAFITYRLKAWYVNGKKRLVKSPKIYLRSTGITHKLLGINAYEDLFGNPCVGASWESYVIEQLHALKCSDTDLYYYRTHGGSEVDIVIVRSQKPLACVEIKLSNTPNISKGLRECIEDLGTKNNYVITPSADIFAVDDSITICNITEFLKDIYPKYNY